MFKPTAFKIDGCKPNSDKDSKTANISHWEWLESFYGREWIPITRAVPKPHVPVLFLGVTAGSQDKMITVGMLDNNGHWCTLNDEIITHSIKDFELTHWHVIPHP